MARILASQQSVAVDSYGEPSSPVDGRVTASVRLPTSFVSDHHKRLEIRDVSTPSLLLVALHTRLEICH